MTINPELVALVKARDRGLCQWPGCERRAADIHHIIARGMGGSQDVVVVDDERNLISLCRYHHERAEGWRAAVLLLWVLSTKIGYTYDDLPFGEYALFFDEVLSWYCVGARPYGWELGGDYEQN